MKSMMFALVVVASACGGKSKPPVAEEPGFTPSGPNEGVDKSGEMVPPETIEEIHNMLARKQNIMSRCLANAVDSKELPKNARGKVLVELVVSTSGAPRNVTIAKSSLESASLQACVKGHVESIVFPAVPTEFPTSYTYGFEAM